MTGKAKPDSNAFRAHVQEREDRLSQMAEREAARRKAPARGKKPAQVASPMQPGMKKVPDPWEPGAFLMVPCNLRESPMDHMAARGGINNGQRFAGDKYRALYEAAQISPLVAANPMKEPVDGGMLSTHPLSDHVRQAMKDLVAVHQALGRTSAGLLVAVIGEGTSIDSLVTRFARKQSRRSASAYVSGRFREALDELVRHWGINAHGRARGTISAERDVGTLVGGVEWEVGRRGELVHTAETARKLTGGT